ncbi:MAG: arginine repressor [Lachnospiraceae bacterium]|nr:arginine repressor [Lachnospiraceae bacterium]
MKRKRQQKIKEIITNNEIATQKELEALLLKAGHTATQATISRDISELKITKIKKDTGRQKYHVFGNEAWDNEAELDEKFINVLKSGFISVEAAGNILVVKTVSGMAMAVAAAIDAMKWKEILGSIAGDDTIMIAVRSLTDGSFVCDKINEIIERE